MYHVLPVNLSSVLLLTPHHNAHINQPPPLLVSRLIALVAWVQNYVIPLYSKAVSSTQFNSNSWVELSQVGRCDHALKLLNAICTAGSIHTTTTIQRTWKQPPACRETVESKSSDQKWILKSPPHSLYVDIISSNVVCEWGSGRAGEGRQCRRLALHSRGSNDAAFRWLRYSAE